MTEKRDEHLAKLLAMVEDPEEDRLTCIDADALLPEFHQAMQLETHDQPRWQSLLHHLRTCPACAGQIALLAELDRFALGEAGVEPDRYPEPDLSALRGRQVEQGSREATETRFWHVDQWGRIIVELSERALRGRYDAPALEARAGLAEGSAAFQWGEELGDLNLSVEVSPCLSSPGDYDLSIRLDTPDSASPSSLAGARVTVYQSDTLFTSVPTTDSGLVSVRIPPHALDQLLIEIDLAQDR